MFLQKQAMQGTVRGWGVQETRVFLPFPHFCVSGQWGGGDSSLNLIALLVSPSGLSRWDGSSPALQQEGPVQEALTAGAVQVCGPSCSHLWCLL